MIYEEFVTHIVNGLRRELKDSVSVQLLRLPRNNGAFRDALCLRRADQTASPAIYLEDFWKSYQSGMPLTLIEQEILTCHRKASQQYSHLSIALDDFEKVKERLSIKLIHREKNRELLSQVPHRNILDLAAVCYLYFSGEKGPAATALVHQEHLQIWDVSPEELYQTALENARRIMPPIVRALDEFICDIMLQESLKTDLLPPLSERYQTDAPVLPMYVLTNRENYLGAACMLYPNVLESFSARCQGSFFLLPSSVHEMILLPCLPDLNTAHLEQMVQEINDEVILPEDRLSDRVYRYDPGSGISFALSEEGDS